MPRKISLADYQRDEAKVSKDASTKGDCARVRELGTKIAKNILGDGGALASAFGLLGAHCPCVVSCELGGLRAMNTRFGGQLRLRLLGAEPRGHGL